MPQDRKGERRGLWINVMRPLGIPQMAHLNQDRFHLLCKLYCRKPRDLRLANTLIEAQSLILAAIGKVCPPMRPREQIQSFVQRRARVRKVGVRNGAEPDNHRRVFKCGEGGRPPLLSGQCREGVASSLVVRRQTGIASAERQDTVRQTIADPPSLFFDIAQLHQRLQNAHHRGCGQSCLRGKVLHPTESASIEQFQHLHGTGDRLQGVERGHGRIDFT